LQTVYTFFDYYTSKKYDFTLEEALQWKGKKTEMKTQMGIELFERMIENNFEFKHIIDEL
jgi:hypothetical protein